MMLSPLNSALRMADGDEVLWARLMGWFCKASASRVDSSDGAVGAVLIGASCTGGPASLVSWGGAVSV